MKDRTKQAGFSIIELLVVVIVIGILAAIVMLSFTSIQGNAHDSAVQSDLRQAADNIELYGLDNGGLYPASTANLTTADISATKDSYSTDTNSFIYCRNNSTTAPNPSFAIGAVSKSGKAFYYSSRTEKVQPAPNYWNSGVTPATVCTSSTYLGIASATALSGYVYSPPGWASWVK